MRNRVAHDGVHTVRGLVAGTARVAAVLALIPAALVAVAMDAGADPATTGDVATERFSFGVAGPVGIVAVVLGVGGLVLGLMRHRRTVAARVAAMAVQKTEPMPAIRGEHVA
jgi:hypothetical protein